MFTAHNDALITARVEYNIKLERSLIINVFFRVWKFTQCLQFGIWVTSIAEPKHAVLWYRE